MKKRRAVLSGSPLTCSQFWHVFELPALRTRAIRGAQREPGEVDPHHARRRVRRASGFVQVTQRLAIADSRADVTRGQFRKTDRAEQ
jgi:hypothetical protein